MSTVHFCPILLISLSTEFKGILSPHFVAVLRNEQEVAVKFQAQRAFRGFLSIGKLELYKLVLKLRYFHNAKYNLTQGLI